jgi:UDP-2,4-diacetamido-2,4,6-trideoxy-beta-L-altropyranose hydrolase
MLNSRIVFRADGNSNIGLGHVSRCLALYDILKKSYKEVIFAIRNSDLKITQTVNSQCTVYLIPDSLSQEEELDILCKKLLREDDHLVLDGYHFKTEYQKVVKQNVSKLIVVDDEANWHIVGDLVINHGGSTLKKKYSIEPYTKLLLGLSFCLIRKEFLEAACDKLMQKKESSLLICMGGSDTPNNSLKLLKSVAKLNIFNSITIITGSAYLHSLSLNHFIEQNAEKDISHLRNLNPEQLVSIIKNTEVCIASASTISLEIASVHAGLIIGISASNQIALHDTLIESGCAVSLNNINNLSEDQIAILIRKFISQDTVNEILKNQRFHFDGKSAERIIHAINSL